jgi:hypothetical protein
VSERQDERAALGGATWIAMAFGWSHAIDIVPAMMSMGAAFLIERVDLLVAVSVVSAVVGLALRAFALYFGLRMAQRPARGVPWLGVALTAALVVVAYPISVGSGAAVAYAIGQRRSVEDLASWSMANAYVSMAAGVAHVLLIVGFVIAAALAWSRRVRSSQTNG